MPKTDGERVVADLKRLAEFGRYKTGVHRPTYSAEDVASRQWLAEKFAEAGLDPIIDGIGNVIGRNPHAARRLLVGSHSETQPHGGWLDGALGVIYALEAARAFAADPALAGLGIEAVAWADEEGHYGNMLGSRSFTEGLDAAEIGARDEPRRQEFARRARRGGVRRQACERLDPDALCRLFRGAYRAGRNAGKGGTAHRHRRGDHRQLELLGHVTGEQNHAGTTEMARRKDAGVALVRLATAIHDRFAAIAGPRTVWTIGRILSTRTRRASCRGGPKCRCSSATPTPASWRVRGALAGVRRRRRLRRPLPDRIAPLSKSAPPQWIPVFRMRSNGRPSGTRRDCIAACRAAPATTRRSWRAGCAQA